MERAYWLAWTQVAGIGAVTIKRIWQAFGSLEQAWHLAPTQLAQVQGIGQQTLESIKTTRQTINPLDFYQSHLIQNPSFYVPIDKDYPPLLNEIPDPPPLLYHQGTSTNWQNTPAIAIVGTRHPTKYGKTWAYQLAKSLAQAGFIVVSGMAEGIDAEAHRGCLDGNGQTIAVLGTSLDKIYPSHHRQLFSQICANGLVLSEYPHATITDKSSFPRRNRIIAGLCRATLVIEAPDKSGALITAHQANDYGREVYALPNSIEVREARGCLELIAKGAGVILGIDELLTALGTLPQMDQPPPPMAKLPPVINDRLQLQIYNIFPSEGTINFDTIAEKVAIPTGELSATLLQMELLGLVESCGAMNYKISTNYFPPVL
jgi:DNA processing protein